MQTALDKLHEARAALNKVGMEYDQKNMSKSEMEQAAKGAPAPKK